MKVRVVCEEWKEVRRRAPERVESPEIGCRQRSCGSPSWGEAVRNCGIDRLDVRETLSKQIQTLPKNCELNPVPDETGNVAPQCERHFVHASRVTCKPIHGPRTCGWPRDDFDHSCQMRWVEEVEPSEAPRPGDRLGQSPDRKARRVRREESVTRQPVVDPSKQLPLHDQILSDRLDRKLGLRETVRYKRQRADRRAHESGCGFRRPLRTRRRAPDHRGH